MNEIMLNCEEIEWEETESYPKGTMRKILRDHGPYGSEKGAVILVIWGG